MALVKICGVRSVGDAMAAVRAGADILGLVFVSKSPRFITPEAAADLVLEVKQICYDEALDPPQFAGLFVDAGERLLSEVAPFVGYFQFHGHEDADRLLDLGAEFGMQTIKAVGVAEAADLSELDALAAAADLLLFDARPAKGASRPGGNGETFDWALLAHYRCETPFLLAGGLTPDNVGAAIAAAAGHPAFGGVDVSSGVEVVPGRKDAELIKSFGATARALLGPRASGPTT